MKLLKDMLIIHHSFMNRLELPIFSDIILIFKDQHLRYNKFLLFLLDPFIYDLTRSENSLNYLDNIDSVIYPTCLSSWLMALPSEVSQKEDIEEISVPNLEAITEDIDQNRLENCSYGENASLDNIEFEIKVEKNNQKSNKIAFAYNCFEKNCGKSFRFKSLLDKHMQSHVDIKTIQCKICNSRFKEMSTYKRHVQMIHSKVSKKFLCNVCDKYFDSKFVLNRHMITHSRTSMFSCVYCHSNFKRKDNMVRHSKKCATRMSQKNIPF